jgi:hypothetical protein
LYAVYENNTLLYMHLKGNVDLLDVHAQPQGGKAILLAKSFEAESIQGLAK